MVHFKENTTKSAFLLGFKLPHFATKAPWKCIQDTPTWKAPRQSHRCGKHTQDLVGWTQPGVHPVATEHSYHSGAERTGQLYWRAAQEEEEGIQPHSFSHLEISHNNVELVLKGRMCTCVLSLCVSQLVSRFMQSFSWGTWINSYSRWTWKNDTSCFQPV